MVKRNNRFKRIKQFKITHATLWNPNEWKSKILILNFKNMYEKSYCIIYNEIQSFSDKYNLYGYRFKY